MQTLIVVLLAMLGVTGDFFLKKAGMGPAYADLKLFFIGWLLYASTGPGWFFVMKHMKLANLGMIYSVVTVVSLAAIGALWFGESLTRREIAGLALGALSIILLSKFA